MTKYNVRDKLNDELIIENDTIKNIQFYFKWGHYNTKKTKEKLEELDLVLEEVPNKEEAKVEFTKVEPPIWYEWEIVDKNIYGRITKENVHGLSVWQVQKCGDYKVQIFYTLTEAKQYVRSLAKV